MERRKAIAIATVRRRQWLRLVVCFCCCAAHLATTTATSGGGGGANRSTAGGAASGNTPHVTTTTPGGYVQLDVTMKNMTKYEGDVLRIKCEITGYPLPRYQWFKDGLQLDNGAANEGRHNVRTTPWGSRLKISQLTLDDGGLYSCVGYNRFGRQETNGELTVKQGPNPNRGSSKSDRDSYDLDFDLDGDVFDSDATDASIYHQHLYPDSDGVLRPQGISTTPKLARFRQSDDGAAAAADAGGFCQPYLGATCSRFVGNKSIFVKDEYQQGHVEERLTTAFTLLATIPGGLSLSCGQFAIPAMCYFAFILCDDGPRSPPRPRSLCRDECARLAAGPCRREYAAAQTARQMNPLTADNRFLLPDCEQLTQANNCVNIGLPRFTDHGSCYNDTGKDYKGFASKTVSGKDCVHWGSVKSPYEPSLISISQHSDLADHNYCRNPDHSMGAPWCFTLSGDKLTKERCAVERCRHPALDEEDEGLTKMLVVLVPCITVASLIAVLATVVQVRRRRRLAKQKSFLSQDGANKVQMNALLRTSRQQYQELSLSSVVIVEELGDGRFGKVYRGELISSGRLAIAVRTISPSAPWRTQTDFWAEIERLAAWLHPNVTCLVGVVTNDLPTSIVQEYTPAGDLHVYLTANGRPTLEALDPGGRPLLHLKDLLAIAVQVAAGMEYLSSMCYVHRDLAARSVIMAGNGLVKVSTVSFTNSAYARDYYYPAGSCQPIPVRWLPPEAIFQDQYTTYSDVWSFGVLLWEIYSFGKVPYDGYTDESTVEMIGYHQILSCPVDCPSRIYSLMVECWHKTPSKRPDFRDVHATLRLLMTELCGGQTDLMVCQTFPGNRSSSSGNNTTNTSLSTPFPVAFNPDVIEVQSRGLVPEVGLLQRSVLPPFSAVHNSYPQHHHHIGVAPPGNQTPKYKKRPPPAASSSSHKSSSPTSSFCSSHNPFPRIGSDYGATDNCLVSQEPSSRWMETMFEDVVI